MRYADQLSRLSESSPEDKIAYSQINKVLRILSQWSKTNIIEESVKTEFSERIGEIEAKIINFLANSSDSDIKSISKAVGLRSSRVSDYLKLLIDAGRIESSGSWRKTYHLINANKS